MGFFVYVCYCYTEQRCAVICVIYLFIFLRHQTFYSWDFQIHADHRGSLAMGFKVTANCKPKEINEPVSCFRRMQMTITQSSAANLQSHLSLPPQHRSLDLTWCWRKKGHQNSVWLTPADSQCIPIKILIAC